MQSPLDVLKQGALDTSLADRAIGLIGIAVILGIAWLLSYDRRRIPWRLVAAGLALQTAFGLLVLKSTPGRWFFESVGGIVNGLLGFTLEGARFIFGNLVQPTVPVGTPQAGGGLDGAAGFVASTGALFAFAVLPTIIFFSALMSVLYHLGVMQLVVKGLAFVMQRSLRTSGAETLSASGNIFLGQTEAPLLIKPFILTLTPSELFTVMVGGFATVAGGVLAAYVLMLQDLFPNIAGHLLAASVMNAPAGLLLSKIIRPEVDVPVSRDSLHVTVEKADANVVEAAASGAAIGVQLALNVGAMLMAFIALIAMINFGVGWLGGLVGASGLTLQSIFGTLLRPLAWVMGVPWADTQYVGGLMGLKVVLNEFVAYAQLGQDLNAGVAISARSAVIACYALLGFANFSSIGIQIGGIGGLAPSRRSDISRFGLRAMIAGNLAAFLSATLAGMLMLSSARGLLARLDEAVAAVRARSPLTPRVGVILGSGLGAFGDSLDEAVSIPYPEIPHFPASTVVGHGGALALGRCRGVPVAVMKGRVHFYEGYSLEQVVFPARVLGRLGIQTLVVTNAAGAINKSYAPGELMVIEDHINLLGNPLVGPNEEALGERFFDMSEAYDKGLRDVAETACRAAGVRSHRGVYLALTGPSFETPAEIRAFRTLGADAVGMSTVPEVTALRHMGIRVVGLSCLTNMAAGVLDQKLDHREVLETGERVKASLLEVLARIVVDAAGRS